MPERIPDAVARPDDGLRAHRIGCTRGGVRRPVRTRARRGRSPVRRVEARRALNDYRPAALPPPSRRRRRTARRAHRSKLRRDGGSHQQARDEPRRAYDVRYRTADGKVRTRTFQRRKDAETHKSLVEADMLRGEWYDARRGRVTFDEWSQCWLASVVNLRPSTRARDEAYLTSLIRPTFGTRLLCDIDRLRLHSGLHRSRRTMRRRAGPCSGSGGP